MISSRAFSWAHQNHFTGFRYAHAQLPVGNAFHPAVSSPGALFQHQTAPFSLRFLPLLHLARQLVEQLTAPVSAVGHSQGGHQGEAPDQQQPAAAGGQAGAGGIGSIRRAHQRFSATRNTALRARGLAVISAAEGLMALPISFRLTLISASRIGRLRGSGSPLVSRRMNYLTWPSSSEWKLITARRPPGASTASAACSPDRKSVV